MYICCSRDAIYRFAAQTTVSPAHSANIRFKKKNIIISAHACLNRYPRAWSVVHKLFSPIALARRGLEINI